jgi:hypothetical protein
MKAALGFLLLTLMTLEGFGASGKDTLENHLVFAHANYKLKDFSFISKNYSVGLVKQPFNTSTLVILYDNRNLVVDSLQTDWDIENVIPENDSIFFLQNKNQTLQCLIRENSMLINGQYNGLNSNPQYEKIAYYTLPLNGGDFNILKRSDEKRSYAIRIENQKHDTQYYPFKIGRKNMNISLDASKYDLFVFLLDESKILKLSKKDLSIREINLDEKNTEWRFYFDYMQNKSYLVSKSRKDIELYGLDDSDKPNFLKDLDFVPEAIFDGSLHKKSSKGRLYSHYLIPIENKGEESILLKDVTISSD